MLFHLILFHCNIDERKKKIFIWGHCLCGFPLGTLGSSHISKMCAGGELVCLHYPMLSDCGVCMSAPYDRRVSSPEWFLSCALSCWDRLQPLATCHPKVESAGLKISILLVFYYFFLCICIAPFISVF